MRRDQPRDADDVVWLADALGPDQAAKAIATGPGSQRASLLASIHSAVRYPLAAGLRLQPTGRNPCHYTVSFDDLEDGCSG